MRDLVGLSCERCKNKNYTATKNKKLTPDKLVRRKFCESVALIPHIKK